jgi:hypothetical protein
MADGTREERRRLEVVIVVGPVTGPRAPLAHIGDPVRLGRAAAVDPTAGRKEGPL